MKLAVPIHAGASGSAPAPANAASNVGNGTSSAHNTANRSTVRNRISPRAGERRHSLGERLFFAVVAFAVLAWLTLVDGGVHW
jgi:hypothetical protein